MYAMDPLLEKFLLSLSNALMTYKLLMVIPTLIIAFHLSYFIRFMCTSFSSFVASLSSSKQLNIVVDIDNGEEKHRPTQNKLPPGSFGLPLIGETLQFVYFTTCPIGTPPPFLSTRFQRYGKVFKTHLMGRPTIISLDPNLNKFLLSNEERLLQVYFPKHITKIVGPCLTMHGARHRRLREIGLTQLSPIAIQKYHMLSTQEHFLFMLHRWSIETKVIDAQHELKYFIFTYMVKFFISLEPTDPITTKLLEDFAFLNYGYSSIPLDLPGTTYNKVLKARRRIFTILRQILFQRRNKGGNHSIDFLDMVMNATDECGKSFNDEDILEFVFFIIFGGFETTTILSTNVMKFLSENQHVVDVLQEEHLSIRKGKKDVHELLTWEDYKQMQFTEQVVKETLRMSSIAHYLMRETCQDILYEDMVIPNGWMVFMNFSMVHLNPNYYPNPLKFDPWRWQDVSNNNPSFLMPFGGGIRSCLGSSFAKFEVSIFIHYLVINYRWERLINKCDQCDVVSSLTLPTLKKGLKIRINALT